MNNVYDDIEEILLTQQQLQGKVSEIADRINLDYMNKKPLIVSVLKGSFVFMADLIRKITIPCTVDFMSVSSYGKHLKTSGEVKIIKDLDEKIEGRNLIVVEDILDSGLTLNYILDILRAREPESIALCALLDKPERRMADVSVDYSGFIIPDKFVVGYGLDYAEEYRNLPYVGVLKPEIYNGKTSGRVEKYIEK